MVPVWPAIWEIYLDSKLIWITQPFPMLSPSLLLLNRTIPRTLYCCPVSPLPSPFPRTRSNLSVLLGSWLAGSCPSWRVSKMADWTAQPRTAREPPVPRAFFFKDCSHLLSPGPPTTPSPHQLSENNNIQQPLHNFPPDGTASFLPLPFPLFCPPGLN